MNSSMNEEVKRDRSFYWKVWSLAFNIEMNKKSQIYFKEIHM